MDRKRDPGPQGCRVIVGLSAAGEAGDGSATMAPEHMGSINAGSVRKLVEELLEGGEEAFSAGVAKCGF